MRLTKLLTTAAIGLLAVSVAKADIERNGDRVRVKIDMNDAQYRGVNILKLKKMVKDEFARERGRRNIDLSRFELIKVRLKAKSARANGYASLLVGKSAASRWENIGVIRGEFKSNRPSSYPQATVIENPSYYSDGKWQLELDGNIKIKRLVVVMERDRGNRGGNGRGGNGRAGKDVLMDVTCSSLGRGYSSCSIGAGSIRDARLRSVHSKASCVRGRSWGVRSNYIWVDRGCRGTFRVTVRENGRDRAERDRERERRIERDRKRERERERERRKRQRKGSS